MPSINTSIAPDPEQQASSGLQETGEPNIVAPPTQSVGSALGEILQTLVLALIIFLLIRNVVQNFRIEGVSMEPNFQDGQFLFINRWAYCPGLHLDVPPLGLHWSATSCLWQPQRGDVIVFRYPLDPTKDYIKRVIGLPGDQVSVRYGHVYVDGQLLPEPYRPDAGSYSSPPMVVPAGAIFVMGDNRDNSSDSRSWGPLPEQNIVGRAWVSYWPPSLWGVVPRWDLSAFNARLKSVAKAFSPTESSK